MRKKKTLYVSDLDGTLLNSSTKVSTTTASILHRLIEEKGAMFTIATARTPATAVPMTEQIGIRLPMIVMTGAAQWIPGEMRYVNTSMLPAEKVSVILSIFAESGINPFVYTNDDNMLKVLHVEDLNRQELDFVEERVNSSFKHFYLHNDISSVDSILIFACGEFETIKSVHRQIVETVDCEAMCYHDIYNANQGFLEIFAPHTSKANAIKQLAAETGAERVVVFGDNLNDISMLSIADVAIAMGNAYPEVKAVADIVIGDNNSDSVARWIETDFESE